MYDSPKPFLSQPRAQSALRHELDAIVALLKGELDQARLAQPQRRLELHALPNRVIARLDDAAISFSWVTGGNASIVDGRLLVIAWGGVASDVKGVAALRSATALREREYAAGGNSPEEWCWRADDSAQQPFTSAQLVGDWLAQA